MDEQAEVITAPITALHPEAKKGYPTPPSTQNQKRRFEFFVGTKGKEYFAIKNIDSKTAGLKTHREMQRFAWTKEGNKLFRALQKEQKQPQFETLPPNTALQIKPHSLFGFIKSKMATKAQRGN